MSTMTTTTASASTAAAASINPAQALLLTEHLRRLRLPVVLDRYPKVAQDAARRNLSYDGFLLALVEEELAQRDENMQKRRLAAAKFPTIKTLDQYDFALMPQLNRQLVLALLQGGYIAAKENILMAGEIGTGKTHVATALGVQACRQGHRVRFYTAAGLTNDLIEAQAAHRLGRFEGALLRHQLLIIDEVGFVPFTKAGADLLFSFLSVLHEQVSLIVTTTVPFAEWTSLFGGDQRLTAALLIAWRSTPTCCNSPAKAFACVTASGGKRRARRVEPGAPRGQEGAMLGNFMAEWSGRR